MVELIAIERGERDGVPSRRVRIALHDDVYDVQLVQDQDGTWDSVSVTPRPESVTDDALLRAEALVAIRSF